MARVLVTGGTGMLGTALVESLLKAGHNVLVMSHSDRPAPQGVERARADLRTGDGLAQAVLGVEAIIHAATDPILHTHEVDVEGARRLLEHARAAGVAHFIYPSIVGIDRVPFPYYRHKLAAERVIQEADIPWTIVRITQFHAFIERYLLKPAQRLPLPILFLASDIKSQPIDVTEAANRLAECVRAGPAQRVPDIGGPQVLTLGQMARSWLRATHRRKRIIHLPIPGKTAAAFRAGLHTCPDNTYGKITWLQWLENRYGPATQRNEQATNPPD